MIKVFYDYNEGKIKLVNSEIAIDELAWNPHKQYSGVFLKHLIKGEETENKISCHLVKIEAGAEIATHVHEKNLELHEIISGKGQGFLKTKKVEYIPGLTVVVPENMQHRVIANSNQPLYLLAKFLPALI